MLLSPVVVDGKPYRIELFAETLYISLLAERDEEIDCAEIEGHQDIINDFCSRIQNCVVDLLKELNSDFDRIKQVIGCV